MDSGVAPLLTKGSFSKFFGGSAVTSVLSKESRKLTPVHPLAMSLSIVCQILFILYKKKQLNGIQTAGLNTRRNTYALQNHLKNTIMSGFNNTYTIVSILVFTGSIGAWMFMHFAFIFASNALEPSEQDIFVPGSIVGFASLLFGLNILQFQRNQALR